MLLVKGAHQIRIVGNQRFRDGKAVRTDELRLVGLGAVRRHGGSAIQHARRGQLAPMDQGVVQGTTGTARRGIGRCITEFCQALIIHEPRIDAAELLQAIAPVFDLQSACHLTCRELERHGHGGKAALVEQDIGHIQIVQLRAHHGQGGSEGIPQAESWL